DPKLVKALPVEMRITVDDEWAGDTHPLPSSVALETRLLKVSGTSVLLHPNMHDWIISKGQVMRIKGRVRVPGERHRCHESAPLHYAMHHILGHRGRCDLVIGYALFSAGRWEPHTWLWDGEHVLESCRNPRLYFGVVHTPVEAADNVRALIDCSLPGAP